MKTPIKSLTFLFAAVIICSSTANAQSGWVLQNGLPTSTGSFLGMWFINSNNGFIVGGQGLIMKTTDGGLTWNAQSSQATSSLRCLFFLDPNTGYVAGGAGVIRRTTDGGATWTLQSSGTMEILQSMYFRDYEHGFAGGYNGVLVRTSTAGIVHVDEDRNSGDVPRHYRLVQNFPNPFNPSTTITFSIPRQSHVRLEVFNLAGQSVATLVDELRTAGSYSENFEAVDLSSGVYFYRLEAGSFTETKKFVVLR